LVRQQKRGDKNPEDDAHTMPPYFMSRLTKCA